MKDEEGREPITHHSSLITPFAGKVVVITGAARGLGLGMACGFAGVGAHVVLTDVAAEAGRAAAEKLRDEGYAASFEPLDVRKPEDSLAVADRVVQAYGRMDVWVNNAGVSHLRPAETLPGAIWEESLAVMLSGAFYCCQAAGRHMLARGQGVIINIASVTGIKPIEGRVAYSVPKAGLIMLTEQLGVEWASRGVRVVGIAPGVIHTDMVKQAAAEGAIAIDDCIRRTPLRRLGEIDDVVEAALFLAGDEAAYIVGETLRVDGGWVAYQLF
jgi:NAD(P)-dependent dehydrogenase (short-subunit alcohol dehydrogenase family)